MSLLSGLFTETKKGSAPRFVLSENVERTTAPATHLEQQHQPSSKRTPECRNQHGALRATGPNAPAPPQLEVVPAGDKPQHFIHTAATASPEWIAVRDQYMNHLMGCRTCYAPKNRYCVTGSELRQRYNSTAMEPTL